MEGEPEAHQLKTLTGHKGAVLCCKIHENSLVTAGHDKKIIVWDASNGALKLEIIGHEHIISDLDIYSGWRCSDPILEPYILSSSWDTSVKVWNLRTGSNMSKFTGHKSRVRKVRVLLDPTVSTPALLCSNKARAASGDDDGKLLIWDLITGQALQSCDEHSHFIAGLSVFLDSHGQCCIVSASADATIRLWDASVPVSGSKTDSPSAKTPTNSSVIAIRTPTKYISAITTASVVSTSSTLIPGGGSRAAVNSSTNSKAPLPPISPSKHAHTIETTHAQTKTANSSTESTTETIIIAGDTLGSIFLYRALTGVLLGRLETKCKIVELFVSACANLAYFPSEAERQAASTLPSPASFYGAQSQFVSQERAVLLAQAAQLRRSNNILTKLSGGSSAGSAATEGGPASTTTATAAASHSGSEKGLYLYYVPDNGSTGSFCLVPPAVEGGGSPHSSPTHSGSQMGAVDALGLIVGSHVVSTTLSERLAHAASETPKNSDPSGIRTKVTGNSSKNRSMRQNNNTEDGFATLNSLAGDELDGGGSVVSAAGSVRKLGATGATATERSLPTVSASVQNAKLRKNSTYGGPARAGSGMLAGGSEVDSDGGYDSPAAEGSVRGSGKGKGSSAAVISVKVKNTAGGGAAADGGHGTSDVADLPFPLLQCFAVSKERPGGAKVRHLLFGAREGVLLYCTQSTLEAPTRIAYDGHAAGAAVASAVDNAGSQSSSSVSGKPQTTGARPAGIATRSNSQLPPLRDPSASSLGGSNRGSPVHFDPSKLSPHGGLDGSATGKSGRIRRTRNESARDKVDSFSIRKPALLMTDEDSDEEQPELRPHPPADKRGDLFLTTDADISTGYHIGKSGSGDGLDTVSQSEVSHLMQYYEDLVGSQGRGAGEQDSGAEQGLSAQQPHETLLQSLSAHLAGISVGESGLDSAKLAHEQEESAEQDRGGVTGNARSPEPGPSDLASIVSTSTMDPAFWEAANSAKQTYNFRRIRKGGGKVVSPSRASAMYQLSDAPSSGYAYATGNYPGAGQNNSLSRSLLNSRTPRAGAPAAAATAATAALPGVLQGSASDGALGSMVVSAKRPVTTQGAPARAVGAVGAAGMR